MRRFARVVSLPLFFAFALTGASACRMLDVLIHGTEGMAVSRGDFTNGTTRHPSEYDEAHDALRACAERNFGGPFPATVAELWHGGISIVSHDSLERMANGPALAIYQRHLHAEYLDGESYRLRDVITHELAHAMADEYQALRNPLDSLNTSPNAGNLDHVGPFFAACVSYCPGCGR